MASRDVGDGEWRRNGVRGREMGRVDTWMVKSWVAFHRCGWALP